jgi:hypothetical protein
VFWETLNQILVCKNRRKGVPKKC